MILESCWVYVITNTNNGNYYIGISKNPKRRWRDHRQSARKGETSRLYNAVRKHGIDAFVFEPLMEFESVDEAKAAEVHLIKVLDPEYNTTAGGDGGDPTPDVRRKMSEGIKNSPTNKDRCKRAWETKRAMSTPEEIHQRCVEANANMSPEAKVAKSEKLKLSAQKRSPEMEAERQRKRAETVAGWSTEQKLTYGAKRTTINLTRELSEEAQARIAQGAIQGGHIAGAIVKARLEQMSPEDKQARMANIIVGIKRAAANRTQEQKDEITRKRLESRARNKATRLAAESLTESK